MKSIWQNFEEIEIKNQSDPFWNGLIDGHINSSNFGTKLLSHLGLIDHPKGLQLVLTARKLSGDLQDAYLIALDLLELLE
jgi:hypothetical protein